MVADGLRAVLERGDGSGDLEGDGVAIGSAEHPVCGDHVQLGVRCDVVDGTRVVRAVRWRARGCPASMAVAALCAKVLSDVPVATVDEVVRSAIASHGGLARHERHAEAIALRALHDALGS